MEIIEYIYKDNNNLSSKNTVSVPNYNTMFLSNPSERDDMILTSNDRVTSNFSMRDKIFMLDRDAKIELILLDNLGEVRILVVDEFSNVNFASHNIFGVNHLCNLGYILKGHHNNNNILIFDNTKENGEIILLATLLALLAC